MDIRSLFDNKKWAIFLMAFLIGGAIGIIIPLTSTHMTQQNASALVIGVVASIYFFAIAFGTVFINKKMINIDLKRFIAIGLIIGAVCTILFPLINNSIYWFIIMGFIGFGVSFHLVGTQTALHLLSDNSIRGMTSGIYTLLFAFGYAIGTIGGPIIYEKSVMMAFLMGALFLVVAAIIVVAEIKIKLIVEEKKNKAKGYKHLDLSLQGAFIYGFIENTIASLYPVFLIKNSFSVEQMGMALGIFVIGGILGTIPITYIGDKFGREKGLILCLLVSILALLGITSFDTLTYRLIFSLIAGVGIGAIYPTCMALGTENLKQEEITTKAARFTFFYSFGSAAGPVVSALIMNKFSNKYLFSISIGFLVILLIKLMKKFNIYKLGGE